MNNVGYRIMIQYLGPNELSASEIHEDVVELFWDGTISYSMVEKWAVKFKLRQSETRGEKS